MVTVRVDASKAVSLLDKLTKQFPYAVSRAINETMKKGQRQIQMGLHRAFTLRRETFMLRTIKIAQFAKKDALIGVIGVDPARDFLAKFEEGGRKYPKGSALTVPVNVRRTKSDIVVKSMRVRSLGLTAHRTAAGAVQLKGLHRTFAVKGPTGGAILQRVGRKPKGGTLSEEIAGGSVRILYAFKRSVPIPANLKFMESMNDALALWQETFAKEFDNALRTAR
jgi:hypothetical protein